MEEPGFTPSQMVQCPSCARPSQPRLVCQECGAPFGVELDCFSALGLPRRLVIDTAQLEAIYHELGRRVHPDRFAASDAAIREASLKSTALLTRSYRTLRDPVSRGLYWLELHGEKLAENNKRVPPEIAELVFEVQEELAGLRLAEGAERRAALRESVFKRREELGQLMAEARRDLLSNFARWDEGARDGRDGLVGELKALLSRIAYLRTLIRDVDREIESAEAA